MTRSILLGAFFGVCLGGTASSQSLGTTFTYQGQLTEAGQPALGLYDLQVCVFDSPSDPLPLDCAPDFDDVPVEDGAFTITLDFGADTFNGQQRWLELRVRDGGSSSGYTILSPRQLTRPAPEALRANTAEIATTAVTASTAASAPWTGLSGIPAGFADGVDHDSGGTVTSITAGTGLTGGTITGSGTIGIADGGVGTAQIAPGAIGQPQIDPTQVQSRVVGACPRGFYLRGINGDGTVICEALSNQTLINGASARGGYELWNDLPIAIAPSGLPVIAYHNLTNKELEFASCIDPACAEGFRFHIVDDTFDVGRGLSMTIGSDGLPVMSYYDDAANNLKVAKCADAECSATLSVTTLDDDPNSVGLGTSIVVDANNNPTISYHDATARALKVARCTNSRCTGALDSTVTVDDPAGIELGRETSIALGADGLPIISYVDQTQGRLRVAKCQDLACTTPAIITVVDDSGDIGAHSSIAIGVDGLPIIAYQRADPGNVQAVKVAKCHDASCSGNVTITQVNDSPHATGFQPSLVIGADGLPVITHGDITAGRLAIVRCLDLACTTSRTSTISSLGNRIGLDSQVTIGDDGLPVIATRTYDYSLLVIVKCQSLDCR